MRRPFRCLGRIRHEGNDRLFKLQPVDSYKTQGRILRNLRSEPTLIENRPEGEKDFGKQRPGPGD